MVVLNQIRIKTDCTEVGHQRLREQLLLTIAGVILHFMVKQHSTLNDPFLLKTVKILLEDAIYEALVYLI